MINVKAAIAKVARIIDEYSFVINKGAMDSLKEGSEYFIVELGEVILDPDTGEELEHLHIVKGSARIATLQERISTLRTSERNIIKEAIRRKKDNPDPRNIALRSLFALTEYETVEPAITEPKKIINLKVGDLIIPK